MDQWFSWLEHGRPFARWHTVSMYVDPSGLAALTSCRLIALDKCSRVRPIEIGETARHILGKAILAVMGVTFRRWQLSNSYVLVKKQNVWQLYMP